MRFAYARVSSDDQNLDRQLDLFKSMGVKPENIFMEKLTGKNMKREQFELLLGRLREGDTLIIESLSRLSRSAKDLLSVSEQLKNSGVVLVSSKEQIDTSTASGKMLFTILAAIVEFEREIIVERTKEGLASARARGRRGGRPPVDPKKLEKAVKLHTANAHSVREITILTGVSQTSLYRELNRHKGLDG
jgi:DNA invertase Pin-like site-specific DNA recombinase